MEKKTKVLLIDDDLGFIKLTSRALEASGYEVEAAYNADEGFTKVEHGRPDIVVLDLIMERHDSGFILAKRLRDHPAYKNIPIIMVTAVGEKTGFRFCMENDGHWMNVDDYVEKPVEPDDLVKRIETLLSAARSEGP